MKRPAGDDVLPAGRRRGSPAPAQVRDASAGARDRDARARARRSEVDHTPIRGSCRRRRPGSTARATSGPVRASSPTNCTAAGARPAVASGALALASCARARRERSWNLTAIPAAVRIVRSEGIDVVLTTSPPNSVHLVGAAVQAHDGRALGRGSARLDRRPSPPQCRARVGACEGEGQRVASRSLVARRADVIVAASDAIADEARTLEPRGNVTTILNGADFDDFAGLEYRPWRPLPHHAYGQLLRQARSSPVPKALAESGLQDVSGAVRRRLPRRPTASGPRRSGSATGWSSIPTCPAASRSRCSATPMRCSC